MVLDFPTELVMEGSVRILVPKLKDYKREAWEYAPSKAPVFYNPLMEVNRDIAVISLQVYRRIVGRDVIVAEPLAGCGVRGIRFAVEVDGVKYVMMNDINPKAVELTKHNIRLNKIEDRVSVKNEDANLFLSRHAAPNMRFDFIDLDPFGSPSPYMDSAIRALKNGGLIALTATDMAPLCGVYPKVSMRKYGGRSLRTEYCHEIAVRLLIGSLVMTAAKHDIGVKPILGYSMDHYIRLYAIIRHGARIADDSIKSMGYILHCFKCLHRETVKGLTVEINTKCSECGSRMSVAGPLWLGEIFDGRFCDLMISDAESRRLNNRRRILRFLYTVKEEVNAPIAYYVIDKICDRLNLPVPPLRAVIRELRRMGFEAIPTHFNGCGVRTDAPSKDIARVIMKLSG